MQVDVFSLDPPPKFLRVRMVERTPKSIAHGYRNWGTDRGPRPDNLAQLVSFGVSKRPPFSKTWGSKWGVRRRSQHCPLAFNCIQTLVDGHILHMHIYAYIYLWIHIHPYTIYSHATHTHYDKPWSVLTSPISFCDIWKCNRVDNSFEIQILRNTAEEIAKLSVVWFAIFLKIFIRTHITTCIKVSI